MRLVSLSLTNYRNYSSLQLELQKGVIVLVGANAQGKTNLLEAIHYLATGKSPWALSDRDLISWSIPLEDIPVARLVGEGEGTKGRVTVEVALLGHRKEAAGPSAQGAQLSSVQKRVRINGVPRRATDLMGKIRAVTFSPQDIDLVTGPPQERRHYMDNALSQIDLGYARALQRYSRILLQRNHLLRRMQSGEASAGELDFWDDNLVETGSFITAKRLEAVFNLGLLCSAIHARLTGEGETLEVRYQGRALRGYEVHLDGEDTLATVKAIFHKALADARPRELGQGETVIGPHRDDLEILLEGTSVNAYGSRGQQRTAALAMKLAQAAFIEDRTGEQPVLLLDDVLSELDAARRGFLARQAADYHQVFITTTDLDRIEPHLLSQATIFRVEAGMVIADSTPF